jgi:hypothetical protein
MPRRKFTLGPPQIRDLPCDEVTRDLLADMVQARIHAKVETDRLKVEIDELNTGIMLLLGELGLQRVKLEDWSCGVKPWGSSQLSADMLLLEGVHADVIERCRVVQRGTTIDVRGPKDQDKDKEN